MSIRPEPNTVAGRDMGEAPSQLWRRREFLGALLGAGGAAAVTCAYWTLSRRWAVAPPTEAKPTPPRAPNPIAADRKSDRDAVSRIYGQSVVPLLTAFDGRNLAAADRAIGTLHDRIQMHRAGIAPFTKEIVSWKTRFGVIGRYSSDVWHKLRNEPGQATKVSQYVNEKFRRDILSEDALQVDVAVVLTQFSDDLRASRNRLYADLSLPLKQIRTAVPTSAPKLDQFREEVQRRSLEMSHIIAIDSMAGGLVALAGGWVATDVAQAITSRIVTQILAQLGTAMAAEGIEAGGATVGGAATGAGAGSLGGPVGAIIGIGVGLVIGAIVDWRLSKRFEQKVTRQCNAFLDSVEMRLRDGYGRSPGLTLLFQDTVNATGRVQREAIALALKETCS